MANKQLLEYIQQAEDSHLNKAEILQNLKQAGWVDHDITEAFAYKSLYGKPEVERAVADNAKPTPTFIRNEKWMGGVSIALGYLWFISGANKILSNEFTGSFGPFLKSQISNGVGLPFVRDLLSGLVVPHAQIFAYAIQFTEFTTGVVLLIGGLWSLFSFNKVVTILLLLANVVSFFLVLSFIFALGMPLPWINPDNIFAEGISLEYIVLVISFFSAISYLEVY